MKKQVILFLGITASFCFLQSCAYMHLATLKVDAGGVNSRFIGQSDSWTHAFGAQGGVSVLVMDEFRPRFSAWAGANVSMQGAKYEDDWGEGLVEGLTRLWYLNIPLLARYQLENGFYGEAGIQPGVLVSAKDKFNGESWDYRDWVNGFDLAIPIGVGKEFNNNIGVGVRVAPGLLNINAGEGDISKDRNFVVGVRGTYTIPLKSK